MASILPSNPMDIFLQDPTDIPLPPDEVRIREFHAEPFPDRRRVQINLVTTPFQKPPNGEITITNDKGSEVASLTIIESIDPKMEFTVHLREEEPGGQYTTSLRIYYFEVDPTQEIKDSQSEEDLTPLLERVKIVDRRQTTFVIENHPDKD